jgi:16S rRNA (guanine1207-N2)-methyltransferase
MLYAIACQATETMSHYFDDRPSAPSAPRTVEVVLPDVAFRYETDRAVFGSDRLDAGTRFLLQEATGLPATGDVLDLGCGAGPIALTMALRAPGAHVWAIDVNERARQLCASNADALGLRNVTVAAPHAVPPDVRFDAIWSNPPIRIGKAALHELLAAWLGRLRPDGVAWLVVHRHLGADSLQRWLVAGGWPTTRRGSRGGYRVLRSTCSQH